ncbi:hypothetical protein CDO52_09135 [Nocardiopsis gilva YIM 90087]|uniref:Uncharacterized protein n=2 Tax=Nocardiopsis gilva TaxID=280236 RepID=A0A223S478_9ACTN|nr:hypothetical protein CDO52_09135 [Nocardiopsis gilva YIM 90087]
MTLRIAFDDEVTEREADQHTRNLLRLLERLDIDEVDIARGEPVPGTRVDAPMILGSISLVGLSLKTVLPHIVTIATAWLERSAQKSVTLEAGGVKLEVKGDHDPAEVAAYLALIEERSNAGIESEDSERTAEDGHR